MVLPLYTVTSLVQATIISKLLPWPTTTFPAFTLDSLQSICNAAAGRVSQIVSVKASRHFILNKIQSPNNGVNLGLNGINDSLLEPFASPAAVSSASPPGLPHPRQVPTFGLYNGCFFCLEGLSPDIYMANSFSSFKSLLVKCHLLSSNHPI